MNNPRIGFIGAGTLGTGLALALHSKGYRVVRVASRTNASAQRLAAMIPGCRAVTDNSTLAQECDLVFITTPDGAIEQLVAEVQWRPEHGVVHCSGAITLEVLEDAKTVGASVASFHPLQTLSGVESPQQAADRLAGVTYAIEGQGWAVGFLEKLVTRLGGRTINVLSKDRVLYHAAAVMACGYVTTLLEAATDIWQEMGFSAQEARAALTPLTRATVESFGNAGPEISATGPIVRGDTATVVSHLQALESRAPGLVPLYCILGLESLPLMAPGVDDDSRRRLRIILSEKLRTTPGIEIALGGG